MTFTALVNIMPLKDLLDPQGKAIRNGLKSLGLGAIKEVRVGKHLKLQVEAENKEKAKEQVKEACEQLLANKVMEYYEIEITEA